MPIEEVGADPGDRTESNGAAGTPLLKLTDVYKAFGSTQALRSARLTLNPSEVMILVGENGSGKSTMMKILSGVHIPDKGTIELNGDGIDYIKSPREAQDLGIVTVFQEVLVAEARTVLDNIWLGTDSLWKTNVSPAEKRSRAKAILDQLLESPPDLNTLAEEISLSDRQACCIARALVRNPKVLILDEATSALDVATRDRLFAMLGTLKSQGVGVIFITHRMDEVEMIGDRIEVMRSGESVGELDGKNWTPRQLVQMMTGSDRFTDQGHQPREQVTTDGGEVVLSARSLQLKYQREPFDVEIRRGELLGLAGLEGHGQEDFLHALRGAAGASGKVLRQIDGQERELTGIHDAERLRIAYVPRERGQAAFRWMSIRENFAMRTVKKDARLGWIRPSQTVARFRQYIDKLGIVLGSPEHPITTLSGGNQQKVLISRWLAAQPQILLLNDPTRGIDIGAKKDLYKLLGELTEQGVTVVMLSTELDEHMELMDRVLVFREHSLFTEISREDMSREALVSAFFGEEHDVAND